MIRGQALRRALGLPWVRLLLAVSLGVLVGRMSVSPEADEELVFDVAADETEKSCEQQLSGARRELRKQREELAYVKQSVVVEQEVCFGLREALFEKEGQLSKLTEQLAFYRGIVSPDADSGSVRIYKLELDGVDDRTFQFRLTLLQPVRQSKPVQGQIALSITGVDKGGTTKTEKVTALAHGEPFSTAFDFRYYTEMYGQFRLPEHWTPLRFKVIARPKGGLAAVSETFVWKELLTASDAEVSRDE